jgi:hypothetical protein
VAKLEKIGNKGNIMRDRFSNALQIRKPAVSSKDGIAAAQSSKAAEVGAEETRFSNNGARRSTTPFARRPAHRTADWVLTSLLPLQPEACDDAVSGRAACACPCAE